MHNELLEFYRKQGKVPDLFYYQLNGKSAMENYIEQKNNFLEYLNDSEEDDELQFTIESKVKE